MNPRRRLARYCHSLLMVEGSTCPARRFTTSTLVHPRPTPRRSLHKTMSYINQPTTRSTWPILPRRPWRALGASELSPSLALSVTPLR